MLVLRLQLENTLIAIELSLRCHMLCDPRSEFQEDRTKTAVAIMDELLCGKTYRQTYSSDLYLSTDQCHALHWTDKKADHLPTLKHCYRTSAK